MSFAAVPGGKGHQPGACRTACRQSGALAGAVGDDHVRTTALKG
jgi:hypothetical protein